MNKRSQYRTMESYLKYSRSKSTGEQRRGSTSGHHASITQIPTSKRLNIDTPDGNSKPRSRSLYIRSNQGRRKVVDNQKYIDQLKQTMEDQHNTNVIQKKRQFKHFSPKVFSLSPKKKVEEEKERRISSNVKFQLSNRLPKKKHQINFNSSILCRPWSSGKG